MNRGRSILAFALIATLAACVERKTSPSLEPGVPDVQPAAALTSATIVQTLLASGHDPNNLKVYTTASIAPAPNALVTVAVLTHQSSSAAPAPTLTGGGMAAWDLVATTTFNGATPLDRVTIFRAMSAAPGSGPITITSSVTVSNCQWIVSQWDGVETGGTNGAGAIVQTGATSGTAVNGLTVALGALADPADVGYGVFGIASATVAATAGGGFTRIDEQPSGELILRGREQRENLLVELVSPALADMAAELGPLPNRTRSQRRARLSAALSVLGRRNSH